MKIDLKKKFKREKRMFFVDKSVKKILCKNFEIVMMNCIYKINRYKMSLLSIVDHISLSTTFYIVYVFLANEKKKNFV